MNIKAPANADFDITTRWNFEARPEELTDILLDPDVLSRWATTVFMACETIERGAADGMGMAIRVHTKGFLPHSFFFGGKVTALEPHRWIEFAVTGDFNGTGRMHVEPNGDGRLIATFRWQVDVVHPVLRRLVSLIHPVLVWNHIWAINRMNRLMQKEVYRRRAGANVLVEPMPTFPHNWVPLRRWQKRRFSARGWNM